MSIRTIPQGPTLSLKVLINKQKSKVLFAEANGDFVDVLLSFLTFPLGKVVTTLSSGIGSINTLQAGLWNLNSSHFFVEGAKNMLLYPTSSFEDEYRKLRLNITCSPPYIQYFLCKDYSRSRFPGINISMYSTVATCQCGKPLNREIYVSNEECLSDGAFTVCPSSFIITDDLRVAPIATGILETLNKLGITDADGAELQHVNLGVNDIMKLFKLSLFSATPLTDLIFKIENSSTTVAKPGDLLVKGVASSRKMVLKVLLQKSTNKFLFAEAEDEFVEFLFSFLIVSLGGVESLLGGNTCFKSIDNLYRSVTDLIDNKYFMTPDTKQRLMKPNLAHGYFCYNQFLPLTENDPPKLFYNMKMQGLPKDTTFNDKSGTRVSSFKSIPGQEGFLRKQTMCFVADDLTVTPSLASSISVLTGKGIALSDLKEMEFHIGLEEALNILRASLTSKTVLTDALIKPMLDKLPKLEHHPKQER